MSTKTLTTPFVDLPASPHLAGQQGRLVQWTTDPAPAPLPYYSAAREHTPDTRRVLACERDVRREMQRVVGAIERAELEGNTVLAGMLWDDFDLLCEVEDHLGQLCTLVETYPQDKPEPTLLVRFTRDGYALYCWASDLRFD